MIKEIENQVKLAFGHTSHDDLKLEMYGSMSQGLAIESSDLDLCITGLNCFGDKDVEKARLEALSQKIDESFPEMILSKKDCITETDFPVLKLEISTEGLERQYKSEGIRAVTDESKVSLLYIDITIVDLETDDSIVIKCKNYVKEKIRQNPALRPVCLVLKKMLKLYDLNQPYTGGLGSYSLFLMLMFSNNIAQSFYSDACPSIYPAKLLAFFLSYYGNFNPAVYAICNYDVGNFNLPLNTRSENFRPTETMIVMDPMNEKHNTTSKVFRIGDVITKFKETFKAMEDNFTKTSTTEENYFCVGFLSNLLAG